MATTTPNYGWDVPTSTDYVKDGATAIETLGDDIDATLYTINNGSAKVGSHFITSASLSGASVTVSSAFSATYNAYEIVITDLKTTLLSDLNFRIGTAATAYYGTQIYAGASYATATGNAQYSNTNNGTSIPTGIVSTSTAGIVGGGTIYVQNPFVGNTTTFQMFGSDPRTDGQGRVTNGYHNAATSYTSFTLLAAGTTFTAGTVRVYGLRNS
jgi:hypothetical protein